MRYLYRPVRYADSSATKNVDRVAAIRFYCATHGQAWNLQVCGPERLSNGREGKSFMVATARLSREDLLALREAIDAEVSHA